MTEPVKLCEFRLGDLYLAIDIRAVSEVLTQQAVRPVPLAPPAVRGLISIRGQVLAEIDLRTCLGLEPSPSGQRSKSIAIKSSCGPLCLLVDEVSDVIEMDPGQIESAPEMLPPRLRLITTGVCFCQKRLILVVDEEQIIRLAIEGDSMARFTDDELPQKGQTISDQIAR